MMPIERAKEIMAESDIQFHHFPNTTLTTCCLTTPGGFSVTGESMCANPDDFRADKGQEYALDRAVEKLAEHLVCASKLKEHI